MIGALKNSGFKSGKDFELDYEMGDEPGRDNPSAIKILNPTMYQDDELMQSMQNNLASDDDEDDWDEEYNESIVSSLQKEFKQYDIINKNLTRG